jgi:iron complex transport system ATP-binding protein
VTAIALRAVTVRHGATTPLDGVDLDVPPGGLVAVVGPNGAGKTTLLRAILGLVRPTSGEVTLDGRSVAALSPGERAAAVGWLPQHRRASEPVPVVDVVAAGRFRFAEPRAVARRAARAALEDVGAGALADRPIDRLSGGEAQRVALATLVAQDAGALLLDEPATHLDPGVQRALHGFLEAWSARGRTLVVVTHDLHLLPHLVADATRVRVVGLAGGRVRVDLRLDDPALPDALGGLYGVVVRGIDVDGRRHLVVTGLA